MQIIINTSSFEEHAKKLKKISKSAFPSAIRQMLNDAAYDLKTKTMPDQSIKDFTNRQDNFFKANSSYEKAIGNNISTMKSTVGFVGGGLKGQNNRAVDDLEEQEEGGSIEKKSFIPMSTARKSASVKSLVRPNARLSRIKTASVVDASKMGFSNPRANFIVAAHKAGVGGHFISNNILWQVDKLNPANSRDMKLTGLYNYKSKRSVNVKATHFMREASLKTFGKLDDIFIKHAQAKINKIR
jgi:hypothetical protein